MDPLAKAAIIFMVAFIVLLYLSLRWNDKREKKIDRQKIHIKEFIESLPGLRPTNIHSLHASFQPLKITVEHDRHSGFHIETVGTLKITIPKCSYHKSSITEYGRGFTLTVQYSATEIDNIRVDHVNLEMPPEIPKHLEGLNISFYQPRLETVKVVCQRPSNPHPDHLHPTKQES
jgi:hypothetical protein